MSKKKKYMVVPRSQNVVLDGLKTTKGNFDFKGKTAAWVDSDIANEIDSEYGRKGSNDVWVARDENLEWHNHHDGETDGRKVGIHHYTFSGVDMKDIKTTKDNGYVWARTESGKQTRMPRVQAIEEGYEIIPQRREKRRKGAEVDNVPE